MEVKSTSFSGADSGQLGGGVVQPLCEANHKLTFRVKSSSTCVFCIHDPLHQHDRKSCYIDEIMAPIITNVDQKALRNTKFPPEFNQKVDTGKINVPVIKK